MIEMHLNLEISMPLKYKIGTSWTIHQRKNMFINYASDLVTYPEDIYIALHS